MVKFVYAIYVIMDNMIWLLKSNWRGDMLSELISISILINNN